MKGAAWRTVAAALLALPGSQAYTRTASLYVLEETSADHGHRTLHYHHHHNNNAHMAPDGVLDMNDLSELHQRIMGLHPKPVDRPLPIADFFHRPSANLVVVVGGVHPHDDTPFFRTMHEHEQKSFQATMHCNGIWDIASAFAGPNIREAAVKEHHPLSNLHCVAVEGIMNPHGLCNHHGTIRDPLHYPLDMSYLSEFDTATQDAFSPTGVADKHFLSELQELLNLPSTMTDTCNGKSTSEPTGPDTYVVFSDSVEKLEAAYGKESSQVSEARRLLDKAVKRVFDKARDTYRGGVISEIVLTHKLGMQPPQPRRLQTTDDDNTAPSLEKIASVNLLTWTSVGLVVVLLLAINVICSADSGPKDSLLYAKFQADTSSSKSD